MSAARRPDDPRVERTRALVIAAAAELLMQDGPGAITHTNVASAASVSRTTVYNHWPTREDLLRATIDSIDQSAPDIDDLTGTLRIDLGILCQRLVTDLIDDQRAPLIANMMERALHDEVVESVRNQFFAEYRGLFRVVLDKAMSDSELRRDLDADRAMAGLLGSLLFARFLSPDEFDQHYADAVIDDFITVNAPR
ncbi:MAG TPA: TetR/AcrR family transcriptional regulator [Ilumatobacteraceae bacterium]|nr:TetR/AcrR family transcriptional regulator [Ilumatobacteraceae bacterium]